MRDPNRRSRTITERARREQLIGLTVSLIAEHGYAATSLARIADAAEISKAAVLYHFPSKNAVIVAAYEHVIGGLTEYLGDRVLSAASPSLAVEAYVDGMIGYLADHPDHVRVIIEALGSPESGSDGSTTGAARWGFLSDLIRRSQEAGTYRRSTDPRVQSIMINGAIDAVVAEAQDDRSFDLRDAAASVIDLVRRSARD